MDLNGKKVIISGGISGIGLETCKKLIKSNISCLAILDIVKNPKVIEELQIINKSMKLLFIKTDVTCKESVENAFDAIVKEFSTIDIVLCNAGQIDEIEMEQTFQVNFFGVVYMTSAAIRLMSKSNGKSGGVIMATSSVAGLGSSFFCVPAYSASKSAVIGYYRSLSNEYYFDKHNIKFILMCPGITQTPILENFKSKLLDLESFVTAMKCLKGKPRQSADTMSKLMIDALKIGENGSIWIGEDGKLRQVHLKEYWP